MATPEQLDPRLIRRIVRLVAAYVVSEAVRESDLLEVFGMTGADERHARAVRAGLAQMNIRVLPGDYRIPGASAVGGSSASPDATGSGSAPRTAMDSTDGTPHPVDVSARVSRTNGTADPLDAATGAARNLLGEDRRSRSPWKRLLTADEENGLAVLMRGADAPVDMELPRGFRARLDEQDERARAFDAFVLHNLRLVWSLARDNIGQGLDLADLEQHGVTGLIRAVEKFDATQGNRFSTYSTWWIRQSISRSLADEGRLIRLPVHVVEKINKLDNAQRRLLATRGRAPLFDLSAESGLRPDEITDLLKLSQGVVSLDLPLSASDGATLGDLIEERASHGRDPASQVTAHWKRQEVIEALKVLADRDANVLALRAGLYDDEPRTLQQIGDELGVSRERIRQIESKAQEHLVPELCRRGLAPRPLESAPVS